MDNEFAEIIGRLEELRANAHKLGQKQQEFIDPIKAAEDKLRAAQEDVAESIRRATGE